MHKARKILGIIMVFMMVLTMGGTLLSCLDGFSYAVGESSAQPGESAVNETGPSDSIDPEDNENNNEANSEETDVPDEDASDDLSNAADIDPEKPDDKEDGNKPKKSGRTLSIQATPQSGTWNGSTTGGTGSGTWELDADGVLTIIATTPGTLGNDSVAKDKYAWYGVRASVTKVVIGTGVTGLGNRSFNDCPNLTEVVLGPDLENMSSSSKTFTELPNLTTVDFSQCTRMTSLGKGNVFSKCPKLENLIGLSNCKAITTISVAEGNTFLSTRITDLDLEGLSQLTEIKAGDFSGITTLKSVNLKDCSKLTDGKINTNAFKDTKNVEVLNLIGTNLKPTASGFSPFKSKLKELYLSNNNTLRGINLRDFSSLKTIYFEGTEDEWNALGINIPSGVEVQYDYGSKFRLTAIEQDNKLLYYLDDGNYKPANFDSIGAAYSYIDQPLYYRESQTTYAQYSDAINMEMMVSDYGLAEADEFIWNSEKTVVFTMKDGMEPGTLSASEEYDKQSLFDIQNADLTIRSITINGGSDKRAAAVSGGSLTLGNGAVITDCRSTENGGGIYLQGGSLVMGNGSEIKGCDAGGNGSAVYLDGGSLVMTGGSISGCSSSSSGGAVYVANSGVTLKFSGNPQVRGNKTSGLSPAERNIYIGEGVYADNMIQAVDLVKGAEIGIYIDDENHSKAAQPFGHAVASASNEGLSGFINDKEKDSNGNSLIGWYSGEPGTAGDIVWASGVKVKFVEMSDDGSIKALDKDEYPDSSFIMSGDSYHSIADLLTIAGIPGVPLIQPNGKCYYHYKGMGPEDATNVSQFGDYKDLDSFYLKNSDTGLVYSSDGQGDGEQLGDKTTVYIVYSQSRPKDSAGTYVVNNTNYNLKIQSISLIDGTGTKSDGIVVLKDENGNLCYLRDIPDGKQIGASEADRFVVLHGAGSRFVFNGGFVLDPVPSGLEVNAKIGTDTDVNLTGDVIKTFDDRVGDRLNTSSAATDDINAIFTATSTHDVNVTKTWVNNTPGGQTDPAEGTESIKISFLDSEGEKVLVKEADNHDNPGVTVNEALREVTLHKQADESWSWTVTVPDNAVNAEELEVSGFLMTDLEYDRMQLPDKPEDTLTITNTRAICTVNSVPFVTLRDALNYIIDNKITTATIKMIVDYVMPATGDAEGSDSLVIPDRYDITITTESKDAPIHPYKGEGETATITRGANATGCMFDNYYSGGSLTIDNVILDGDGVESDSAVIHNRGSLLIKNGSDIKNAKNLNGDGAAINSSGGEVFIQDDSVELSGNEAKRGGAVFVSGGSLSIEGASIKNNKAEKGGAIYFKSSSGGIEISGGAELSGNTASADGGAVYAESGTLDLLDGTIEENTATEKGGAVYAESASVNIRSEDSSIRNNTAGSGGAVYVTLGRVQLEAGSIANNTANSGNGGAIYAGSGSVTVESGSISDNTAANGLGGAIYADSATVNIDGTRDSDPDVTYSTVIRGNEARNGSALFINTGIANIATCEITANTAQQGGAIGIGNEESMPKLNFDDDVYVSGNTMNGSASNVYLDRNSDMIINTSGLGDNALIGVYVSGGYEEEPFKDRGTVGCTFASYTGTSTDNLDKFRNDRLPNLKAVSSESTKLVIWSSPLPIQTRYLASYSGGFPADSKAGPGKNHDDYAPASGNNALSDIADDLYSQSQAAGKDALFGGAFAIETAQYADYATDLNWDNEKGTWKLIKADGGHYLWDSAQGKWKTDSDTPEYLGDRLIIYYADPAYVSVENNSGIDFDSFNITVLGKQAVSSAGYGFVIAKNGTTRDALRPATADDLKLKSGESIKLVFPGGRNADFEFSGSFATAPTESVKLIRTGKTDSSISGQSFTISDNKTLNNNNTYEIIFGERNPICKIESSASGIPGVEYLLANGYIVGSGTGEGGRTEYLFSSLRQAVTFGQTYLNKDAKIEMLIDYLIPEDDTVTLPSDSNYSFTTAAGGQHKFTPPATDPDREKATISRDSGNTKSFISMPKGYDDPAAVTESTITTLEVSNLIFDGRNLGTGSNDGGVISTKDCKVTISGCNFKNCTANNGGALYTTYTTGTDGTDPRYDIKHAVLEVTGSKFSYCSSVITGGSDNRRGGGAIHTTAKIATLTGCTFEHCKTTHQGGAVFHKSEYAWSNETKTIVSNCNFNYCEGEAAGGIELDTAEGIFTDCNFSNCIATKRNGGALNIYARGIPSPTVADSCSVTFTGGRFVDCHADSQAQDFFGGAFRSNAIYNDISGASFNNNSSMFGGSIAISNANAQTANITDCTIENSTATKSGGGIYCKALNLTIDSTEINSCIASWSGGGVNHDNETAKTGTAEGSSTIIRNNSKVSGCTASSKGGGISSIAYYVELNSTIVEDCVSGDNGGGVNFGNTKGGSQLLDSCTIQRNTSGSKGGGVYAYAATTLINTNIINNRADTDNKNDAAGIYMNNCTLTIGKENAASDSSTVSGNKLVKGTNSNVRLWETNGVNNVNSVLVRCHELTQPFGVVNAANMRTQFGTASENISNPGGFADKNHMFTADDNSLYGIVDRNDPLHRKLIWAGPPICKITDANDNLLYFDAEKTRPAIFDTVDDRVIPSGGTVADGSPTSAFNLLRGDDVVLYGNDGQYTGSKFKVKMLVENHTLTGNYYIETKNKGRDIVLTTEESTSTEDYPYRGMPGTQCTILRSSSAWFSNMVIVRCNMDIENITLDGGYEGQTGANYRIIYAFSNGVHTLTLGNKATIRNSRTSGNGGGALIEGAILNVGQGAVIENCNAAGIGGGVLLNSSKVDGVTHHSVMNFTGGSIINCSAGSNGGGINIAAAKLNMSGSSRIEGCRSTEGKGGGVFLNNGMRMNMSGGSIRNNTAFDAGGGIAVGGVSSVLDLSGTVYITDNRLWPDIKSNIGLNYDSNNVINTSNINRNSIIGVYVPGDDTGGNTTLFDKHGRTGRPFGKYTVSQEDLDFRCFVNDRTGARGGIYSDGLIYWVENFSLTISKKVISDIEADMREYFSFTVVLSGGEEDGIKGNRVNGKYGDMIFTNGVAYVSLRNNQKKTADTLPFGVNYTVTEDFTTDRSSHYETTDTDTGEFIPGLRKSGTIGENINKLEDRYVSKANYTNKHTSGSRNVVIRKVSVTGQVYKPASHRFFIYKSDGENLATDYYGNLLNTNKAALTSSDSGVIWAGKLAYGTYVVRELDPESTFYLIVGDEGSKIQLDVENNG